MSNKDFPEGVALVFGGSGGIGRGVVKTLAEAGTDVAIAYRSKQDVAEKVADEVRAGNVKASTHATDVTDPDKVKATIDAVAAEHGRIHTIVFGAGPLVEQVFLADLTPELWQRAIDTETKGFFNVVSAGLPHLKQGGGGSFVHMGSAGHMYYPPKDGLSVIPKAANEALVKGIAKEEGVHNIRANSVLIGVIDAGMFHTLSEQGVFDEEWIRETHKMLCLKRWGEAEEVGHAVTWLASSKAAYITGQQINCSGGFGV